MVIDSLCNLAFYNSLNPRFEKVVEYFKSTDVAALAEGKYEIDGSDIFINIVERDLKKPEDAALEVHDDYIDIQVVLSGRESFGWKKRCACEQPRGEMNTEKDILFYDDASDMYFTLGEKEMSILFPADAHAPLVGEGHVKKAIVKVKVK
ncbi:MAG: YhcH/YjgK/YiaL family protein [Rikenellaceae bacterium]